MRLTTPTRFAFQVLMIGSLAATPSSYGQSNSKGPDSPVVVGKLTVVDASGTKLQVLQAEEFQRELQMVDATKIYYIGLPDKKDHKPTVGYGVKAQTEKNGRLKSISFTPSIGEFRPLGNEKLTMTEEELFEKIDQDADGRASYIEFSETIYHSPKHGPDSFRKADKNTNGTYNQREFDAALKGVSWWKLSRQTPDQWIAQADRNEDNHLSQEEFAMICTSGNHIENIFKRTDLDKSGQLSKIETTAYIRGVTHGESSKKKK